MPKRRAHGSGAGTGGGAIPIGGGAGGGAGGSSAVAVAGTEAPPAVPAHVYSAEVYSRTRGRTESLEVTFDRPRRALVASTSGRVYEVQTGESPSCTCPDYVHRAARYEHEHGETYACRHIRAVAGILGMPRPEPAIAAQAEPARAVFAEPPQVAEITEEPPAQAPVFGEPEVSLADDAAFHALMEQARLGPPPYEYEDVLADPQATFGVEIEFNGGDRQAIARELYEMGLLPSPQQGVYHNARVPGMWSFESDGSVTGGELVSPVFRDTPETWRQIEQVCEVVRRHGGSVAYNCGGHVHIGSERPLDSDHERWNRILRICRENEDLLYRLAAGGSELGGQHRGTHYARPVAELENLGRGGRYHALNRRANTVEFRYFNGTLDPRQIQTNVRLAHGIVQAAARRETDETLRGRGMPLGRRADRDPSRENHAEVRRFLDTIFSRARDKTAALWLYATSRWQRRIDYYRGAVPA